MKVVYVDPQSGNNLALYDYNLLENIDAEILYCCSIVYDAPILESVKYHYIFKYNRLSNSLLKAISYFYSLVSLLKIIKCTKPDVIHIQWWRLWFLDYFFLGLYQKYCKKIVYTAHNIVPHDSGHSMDARCRKYYEKVDSIIVHVEKTKTELCDRFMIPPDKVWVIPHGVLNTIKSDNDSIVKELVINYSLQGKIVFSSLGHQSPYKGTDIILKAYKNSVFFQNANCVLIIAGKGNIATRDLMEKYSNLIILDEFLPSEVLDALYDISDVLLLPYRDISQSGVLLTAVAKHIPYIATDVGGLLEPLLIAPIAWELPDNTPVSLTSLIELLVNNPKLIEEKKNCEGWKNVEDYYNWAKIGEKTRECYLFNM